MTVFFPIPNKGNAKECSKWVQCLPSLRSRELAGLRGSREPHGEQGPVGADAAPVTPVSVALRRSRRTRHPWEP